MKKNEFGVILSSELGREINVALLKGNTDELFSALASYMRDNDFNLQEAASILLRTSKTN